MAVQRSISGQVQKILAEYGKMVLVSGPRQVGKTFLAHQQQARFSQSLYFNWDVVTDQKRLIQTPYFFENADRNPKEPFLVVLDEIHKYARWKNYLKGAYDGFHEEFRFLVTGSGRLELFKKGGDSLLGRTMAVPLFPFSVGELSGSPAAWGDFVRGLSDPPAAKAGQAEAYENLFRFSGFPEPFLKGEAAFYNMWFQERKSLLIREDIRDASNIRQISLLEMLSHLIPDRVGSPLSVNSLKGDVGVAFETVRDWLTLLERFFYLVRIAPFAGSLSRSLKKETKAYLYDWVEVALESIRFENMVGMHLYKAVQTWRAMGAGNIGLHYLRDKEKREVDFLIVEGAKPVCLVECKASDLDVSPALLYFQNKLKVPTAVQLVHKSGVCRKTARGGESEASPSTSVPGAKRSGAAREGRVQWVVSADTWLGILP